MAGEKFYLIFSEEPNKRIQINEPVGYSEVDFNLDQRENKMGRDVSLSGGTINFKFTIYRHGQSFEKILYYAHRYGFEAKVKLIIVLSDGTEYIGELDFLTAESNDFNYFQCPVIVGNETQIFRRRSETPVDLFSNVDINGEFIPPLVPVNMLLKAKPAIQTSIWEQPTGERNHDSLMSNSNFTASLKQSEILNSYTFLENYPNANGFDPGKNNFVILEAQTSLRNVSLTYTGDMKFYYFDCVRSDASVS